MPFQEPPPIFQLITDPLYARPVLRGDVVVAANNNLGGWLGPLSGLDGGIAQMDAQNGYNRALGSGLGAYMDGVDAANAGYGISGIVDSMGTIVNGPDIVEAWGDIKPSDSYWITEPAPHLDLWNKLRAIRDPIVQALNDAFYAVFPLGGGDG